LWSRNWFLKIFERFKDLWNFEIYPFSRLLFYKTFNFQFRASKLSLNFRFCGYVFLAITPLKIVEISSRSIPVDSKQTQYYRVSAATPQQRFTEEVSIIRIIRRRIITLSSHYTNGDFFFFSRIVLFAFPRDLASPGATQKLSGILFIIINYLLIRYYYYYYYYIAPSLSGRGREVGYLRN